MQRTACVTHLSYRSLLPQGAPASDQAAIFSLGAARSPQFQLLRVQGTLAGHPATLLIDCGATNDFVSADFARRHGLTLTPTSRTVRGYDGAVTPSAGLLRAPLLLTATSGASLPDGGASERSFTCAPLHGEDAILGLPWLRSANPVIDWEAETTSVHDGGALQTLLLASRCTREAAQLQRAIVELFTVAETEHTSNPARDGSLTALLAASSSAPTPPATGAASDPTLEALRAKFYSDFADVMPDELPAGIPPARNGLEHHIPLKPDCRPSVRGGSRNSREADAAIEAFVKENLDKGFIRRSQSSFAAIPFQVAKKGTDEKRTVVDFRGLNAITVPSRHPLPRMDELFDRLKGARCFSKLDLRTGFHQIPVAEVDRHKTAFRTSSGLYEFCVLAMGLCGAPGTFQQLMHELFGDLAYVVVFLDDILIFSCSVDEHRAHLTEVYRRLRLHRLYAKRSKCDLFQSEVEFLGHHVGVDGLRIMEDKLQAVVEWPVPTNVREVRAFLGLIGFYRRFIRDFSRTALPITQLTRTVTGGPFA